MVSSPRRRQKYRRIKPPRTKPRREELAKDDCLCFHCPAKCCCYFALPIEEPTEWEDFEFIRWYLLHERATVFVDESEWYLLVHNRCKALRDDNLCGEYETRPQICRDYTDDKCEYEDDWVYDQYFETHQQILEYAEATLGPRLGKDIRTPRPVAQYLKLPEIHSIAKSSVSRVGLPRAFYNH